MYIQKSSFAYTIQKSGFSIILPYMILQRTAYCCYTYCYKAMLASCILYTMLTKLTFRLTPNWLCETKAFRLRMSWMLCVLLCHSQRILSTHDIVNVLYCWSECHIERTVRNVLYKHQLHITHVCIFLLPNDSRSKWYPAESSWYWQLPNWYDVHSPSM